MRALVQRVTRASVVVDDEVTGAMGAGLCVLVGVTHGDGTDEARALAAKVWHLRVFEGDDGRMDLPVAAVGGEVLVVSQFTLYGDTSKGRRPSWVSAAPPEQAEPDRGAVRRAPSAWRHRGHWPLPRRHGGGARQ